MMSCDCEWYCEQRPDCRALERRQSSCVGATQTFALVERPNGTLDLKPTGKPKLIYDLTPSLPYA